MINSTEKYIEKQSIFLLMICFAFLGLVNAKVKNSSQELKAGKNIHLKCSASKRGFVL